MKANVATTALGTSNIALVKYWGKREEKLILPQNSSLSITLDEKMSTVTSVVFSGKLDRDRLFINGVEQDLSSKDVMERFAVLDMLREAAGSGLRALVVSRNAFPTASGLASSASGIAALVYAAAEALELKLPKKELSIIARQGSGSACRSMFGGFVAWRKGRRADGTDSYAEQVAPKGAWPEVVDVIAIVSESKKKVSSRAGMKQTVETSLLYKGRPRRAERRVAELTEAIRSRDFGTLAKIAMDDSDDMHATMLDTKPPITYLNDVSMRIKDKVRELNEAGGEPICAYTFDAGPNANVITLERYRKKVLKAIGEVDGVLRIVDAKVGDGPRLLGEKDSLIDIEAMEPKTRGAE